MIFMFLFYGDEHVLATMSREERNALVERHVHYNHEILEKRVTVLATRALEPTHEAYTVRPEDGVPTVRPGPFARPAEALTGFYLIDCADFDEAVELAKEYPMPDGVGCIEVRPAMRAWDYAPSIDTPAPPEAVWRLYRDVDSWPRWKHGIAGVVLDGPFAAGATGRLTPVDHPPVPFRVVSATENAGYVSETELAPGIVLRLTHTLTRLPDGGTRIVHAVTMPRAALDVFGLQFSPTFNAGIQLTLQALAAAAVSEGSVP